jgi:hypothetical protein
MLYKLDYSMRVINHLDRIWVKSNCKGENHKILGKKVLF